MTFFLKSWAFFGEILSPCLMKTWKSLSMQSIWLSNLEWIRMSSVIAMNFDLSSSLSKTWVIKYMKTPGESPVPWAVIARHTLHFQSMEWFHSTSAFFLRSSKCGMHLSSPKLKQCQHYFFQEFELRLLSVAINIGWFSTWSWGIGSQWLIYKLLVVF